MPSYTTSLRLIQPATGEYSGSWGTQVNNGITALVDTSVAGTASITMTAADYTLSTANGATDEARAMFLVLGGTPGAARNVICPAVSKLYYVTNNTTGGFAQTVKTASGSGISVPNGASMVLRCDGTNVVEAQNALGSIVLNGGTANGVAYLNASKALTTGSALVFDGTNLGIGTSSPTYKLDVVSSSGTLAKFTRGSISISAFIGAAEAFWGTDTNHPLAFTTNGTEKMRLDSSGNLGLGVTPSAWASNYRAFQQAAGGGALVTLTNSVQTHLSSNWYYDGADKYYAGGYASRYTQVSGQHQWYTAPSGTTGNAISFTQAMTLDASGNLSVGTTAGGTRLQVFTATDNVEYFRAGTSAESRGIRFSSFIVSGTNGVGHLIDAPGASGVNGTLAFATNSTERARITSGGDLLVGKTAVGLTVGAELQANGTISSVRSTSTSGTTTMEVYSTGAAAYRFYVDMAGTVFATSTTISAISDQRLKENIRDLDVGLNEVMALKPRKFDWKEGKGQDKKDVRGFIAQEFEQVFPDLIDEWKAPAPEGEEPYKSVRQDLIPVLVKAIQEQQALITDLRARVTQLESKP